MARSQGGGCMAATMEVDAMSSHKPTTRAHAGDWIEVRGLPGAPCRAGQILEVLGRLGHERFRVRWDEAHESIFFPTEGAAIVHPPSRKGGRR
jgi:hypothetical protein